MRELAVKLGISRQTLTVWLDRWPDFPIVERGRNGVEYRFDAAAVIAFLRAKQADQARSTADRDHALAQLALPFELDDQAPPTPGASIKDQIEALKLRQMQRAEAERSGQLVEAIRVSDLLVTAVIAWNRAIHNALRQAGREHNLPDSVIRALDTRVATTQQAFVRDLATLIADEPPDAP